MVEESQTTRCHISVDGKFEDYKFMHSAVYRPVLCDNRRLGFRLNCKVMWRPPWTAARVDTQRNAWPRVSGAPGKITWPISVRFITLFPMQSSV
jgi:hypothetical protein